MTVYDEIKRERERQDRKHGGPAHDDNHTAEEWLQFIQDQERYTYRICLVRVAALAVAAVESFDRVQERAFGPNRQPARHAPAQVVQAHTLAHPDPELFHARLKDIDDLGFDLLPNSLGMAAMKSREALVELIQRLLLQNGQALAQGKACPTVAAAEALSAILRDLLDDITPPPQVPAPDDLFKRMPLAHPDRYLFRERLSSLGVIGEQHLAGKLEIAVLTTRLHFMRVIGRQLNRLKKETGDMDKMRHNMEVQNILRQLLADVRWEDRKGDSQ